MKTQRKVLGAILAACFLTPAPQVVTAGEPEETYQDVEDTYGFVPGFFRLFARADVADAWYAFRTLQLNPYIDMEAKTRELIGVAVATQGPCRPCVYFHAAAALANGATKEEIREAVGVGAATRRLNLLILEAGMDMDTFQRETDLLLWGDVRTIERRGPPPEFCSFVIDWTDADYVGCD